MVIRALGLLLLLATPAWAVPAHFTAPDRDAFVFCAQPDRFTGPIQPCGSGWPDRLLGMVAYVGMFPQPDPVPFHAEVELAGAPLATLDLLLPPPGVGDGFTTLGVAFSVLMPPCCDGTVQPVRVTFTLPEDQAVFDLTYETPVPEPATLALLGLSLAGLGWRLRRRP